MCFNYLSPIRNECGSSFEQNRLPYIPLPLYTLVKIGPVVLKEDFQKSSMYFSYYLPLENSEGLHLNKLESPSPKDALCQVWLKFAPWFWRRIFWNNFIWIILNPFTKGCFMPSLVEIGPVALEKKIFFNVDKVIMLLH